MAKGGWAVFAMRAKRRRCGKRSASDDATASTGYAGGLTRHRASLSTRPLAALHSVHSSLSLPAPLPLYLLRQPNDRHNSPDEDRASYPTIMRRSYASDEREIAMRIC
jgi:hypothetical protein